LTKQKVSITCKDCARFELGTSAERGICEIPGRAKTIRKAMDKKCREFFIQRVTVNKLV
jgi:hypothetical protein